VITYRFFLFSNTFPGEDIHSSADWISSSLSSSSFPFKVFEDDAK